MPNEIHQLHDVTLKEKVNLTHTKQASAMLRAMLKGGEIIVTKKICLIK